MIEYSDLKFLIRLFYALLISLKHSYIFNGNHIISHFVYCFMDRAVTTLAKIFQDEKSIFNHLLGRLHLFAYIISLKQCFSCI